VGTLQQALCTKSRQAQNTGVSVVTQSFLHDLGDTLQPGRELFKAFDRKGRKEIPPSSQRTTSIRKLHYCLYPFKFLRALTGGGLTMPMPAT
jgi:hypothetical protein